MATQAIVNKQLRPALKSGPIVEVNVRVQAGYGTARAAARSKGGRRVARAERRQDREKRKPSHHFVRIHLKITLSGTGRDSPQLVNIGASKNTAK